MTTTPLRGIRLSVLKSAMGDTTNGGISATAAFLVLVDDRIPPRDRNDTASERMPAVRLTETVPGYQVLVPVDGRPGEIGPMAGGNYAVGRYGPTGTVWKALTGTHGALPVHDRYETQAQYDALSI
jgi:hypothetical protein